MQKKKMILLTALIVIIVGIIVLALSKTNKISPMQIAEIANYTTKIGDYEYDINKLIQDPKDIKPTLSAGMIPVKMDGGSWKISNKNPGDWYDYSEYKPAYMMLNDGVYQSELVRNMEENGLKLANENIGVEIKQEELGTIYMWVPRIAFGNKELVYIKQECTPEGSYRTYDTFMIEADKWDYSYAGVWVEYEPLASNIALNNKVNRLNKGESDETYGFLSNTKAYRFDSLSSINIDFYVSALNAKSMNLNDFIPYYSGQSKMDSDIIKDYNENNGYCRTVLRVSETNKLEPIKATSYFDTEKEQIIIEVTHNKNTIKEVLFANGEKLEFTTTNGKTVANTGNIEIGTGKYGVTVIDIDGNAYQFNATGAPIYATLYTDGTLGISKGKTTISGKTPKVSYGDIQINSKTPVWRDEVASITTVNFVNKVKPLSTANWFYNCKSLTTIYNIGNLDTSKVTNMGGMFYGCSGLTSLNVTNFDTSSVTNMSSMFFGCNKLTTLDLSNFNTSNVTSMNSMFHGGFTSSNTYIYMNLTSLDLSSFDTSKVNDMGDMFCGCNKLKTLDLSNFNTSNVTSMYCMFQGCGGLTSLNVSSFDTSKVTNMQSMFWRCSSLTRLNLKSFDTNKVTNMTTIFAYCSNLGQILVNKSTWVEPEKDTGKKDMFLSCKVQSVTKQ